MNVRDGKLAVPVKAVQREIQVASSIQHQHIVQLLDFFAEEEHLAIVVRRSRFCCLPLLGAACCCGAWCPGAWCPGGCGSSSACLPACPPTSYPPAPALKCCNSACLFLVCCLQYRLVEGRDLLDELNARGGRLDEPTAAAFCLQLVGWRAWPAGWLGVGQGVALATQTQPQHPLTWA